ncbi:hypothetical protein D3C73_992160 [compost metagenome]
MQESVHGQQFHGRDAQPEQVFDKARVRQRGAGAAQGWAQVFALHRDAAQMHFVDGGVRPRRVGGLAVAPVERHVFGHHGFGHGRRAVAAVHRQVGARMIQPVAKERIAPAYRPGHLAGVGVQQQLVRIETVAVARVIGAVGAIAVDQPGLRVRQVAVPDLVGAFGQVEAA